MGGACDVCVSGLCESCDGGVRDIFVDRVCDLCVTERCKYSQENCGMPFCGQNYIPKYALFVN